MHYITAKWIRFSCRGKKSWSHQYKKNLQTRTVMPKIKEGRLRKAQVHMALPSFQLSSCQAHRGEENVSWGCWGQSPQAVTPSWQFRWINEFVDCWDSLWQVRQCNLHVENCTNYMLINKTTSKTGNPASCSMLLERSVLGAVTQARGQPSCMSMLFAVETISTWRQLLEIGKNSAWGRFGLSKQWRAADIIIVYH